jgi:uncharacterized membrane protein
VLVLLLFLIVKNNKKHWLLMVVPLILLVATIHYTTAAIFIMYLIFLVLFIPLLKVFYRKLYKEELKVSKYKILVFLLISIVGLWFLYYSIVASGNLIIHLGNITGYFSKSLSLGSIGHTISGNKMAASAVGLGFLDASIANKIYIILQWMVQLTIALGFIYMIFSKKFKRISMEYLALMITGGLVIVACLTICNFASLLNTTRWYHIALLTLAPCLVIGGLYLLKKPLLVLSVLIIPYFIFSSGIPFELSKQDLSKVTMPYSLALSSQRLDIGVYTDNDMKVAEYISNNSQYFSARTDIEGLLLLANFRNIYSNFIPPYYNINDYTIDTSKPKGYIFLREWNIEHQELTLWAGSGLRNIEPFPNWNLRIIYKVGNAELAEIVNK